MRVRFRVGIWLIAVGIGVASSWICSSPAWTKEAFVREMLLSVVQPAAIVKPQTKNLGAIDKLLSIPFDRLQQHSTVNSRSFDAGRFRQYPSAFLSLSGGRPGNSRARELMLPGTLFASLRMAGSKSGVVRPAIAPTGKEFICADGCLKAAGSLVADSVGLYSSLEVEISVAEHMLRLFGTRNGRKYLLYSTKVGLGSPDYPTPRGRYYITKIFDDHPLWIPPPDAPWAWGAVPSRSVYGGHMMPLMLKRPLGSSGPEELDADKIAPKMRIVDSGGYRVHGTDSPWSVGGNESHGCIRMKNETVKALADNLKLFAGMASRGESPNGTFVLLARPVSVVLY